EAGAVLAAQDERQRLHGGLVRAAAEEEVERRLHRGRRLVVPGDAQPDFAQLQRGRGIVRGWVGELLAASPGLLLDLVGVRLLAGLVADVEDVGLRLLLARAAARAVAE